MIRILHTYTKNDSSAHNYTDMLMRALPDDVECRTTDDADEYKRLCQEWKPQIVHVHGAVAFHTADYNQRCVLQPNGTPVSEKNYYAIIARSSIEAQRINLPRIEVINSPLITRTITMQEAADKTLKIYRKVMESNPLERMDDTTLQALAIILKAGIMGDQRWVNRPKSEADLHLIYIYARYEGVHPYVERGLKVLGIDMPADTLADGYLPVGYQQPFSMSGKGIVKMVDDAMHNGPTLLRLINLFVALHDERLNEEELTASLIDKNMLGPFQRLLQLLKEQLLLEEGFMPCPAIDDRITRQMRNQLINHLKL